MTDDKDIEKLFSTAETQFDDDAQFMAALNEKLDKVEFIKQIQERKLKSYRISLIVAFAAGAVFGIIGLFMVSHVPAETFTMTGTGFLIDFICSSRNISTILLSLLAIAGTIGISLNIQDIQRMKSAV